MNQSDKKILRDALAIGLLVVGVVLIAAHDAEGGWSMLGAGLLGAFVAVRSS